MLLTENLLFVETKKLYTYVKIGIILEAKTSPKH